MFRPIRLDFEAQVLRVRENDGVAQLRLQLSAPPPAPVTVAYELRGVEAQSSCPERDFEASAGTLTFATGEVAAAVSVLVTDDELAETDESLVVELGQPEGAVLDGANSVSIIIEDDDRTQLIDAADFALAPGVSEDSGLALQAALSAAATGGGRGVVVVAPGDYELLGVDVPAGTTLSGRGAVFHRPALAGPDAVMFRVSHASPSDSAPTLLEGFSVDGRRSEQGKFSKDELQDANLIQVAGDTLSPGRARITLQGLTLNSATGDGIALRDDVDANVCDIHGDDLWRELLSVHGGNIRVVATGLRGSASEGTTGIWFGAAETGYAGSSLIDVELDDVILDSGDLEIVLSGGSRFTARRLIMNQAPFRLVAPDSTVRISDSVLMTGIPSLKRNYFHLPHDVEIRDSVIVLSERADELNATEEADRSLVFAEVNFASEPEQQAAPGVHRLLFDGCQFLVAPDVEPADNVSVVMAQAGGSVLVRGSSFGPGVGAWFAEPCSGCKLEP